MLSISSLWTLAFMSLPEFFYERVTSEIHQQMEGVLALAERRAEALLRTIGKWIE